jgi:hypothetical protein
MGWVVNAMTRPLLNGNYPVPTALEAGWAPGPLWTGAENFAPTGIRSPEGLGKYQAWEKLSGKLPSCNKRANEHWSRKIKHRKRRKISSAVQFVKCLPNSVPIQL